MDDILQNLNSKGLIHNEDNEEHVNQDSDQFDPNTIFVGNLPPYIRKNDLRRIFQCYGEFLDLYYPKGKNFAFIVFKTLENATRAIQFTNGTKIDETVIRVSLARTKKKKEKTGEEQPKPVKIEEPIIDEKNEILSYRMPVPHIDIRESICYDDLY